MITSENYVENVLRTDCEYNVELYERLLSNARMIHAAIGLATESAELLDMLKKHIFYGKPFDKVNAKEECGDASWYIGLAIDDLSTTMNDVLTQNIEKLKLRYPNKFNEDKAINRNVEAERELLEKDVLTDAVNAEKKLLKNINLEMIELIPSSKPLLLDLYTQWDEELKCEYIIVDGIKFIEESKLSEGGIKIKKIKISSAYALLANHLPLLDFKVKDDDRIKQFDEYTIGEFNNTMQFTECKEYAQRSLDWIKFASKVLAHIEEYAVPQYGDKGKDQITDWTVEECLKAVSKRVARYGRQSREGQQELDFLKMVHEVQIAWDKYIMLQKQLEDNKDDFSKTVI